MKKMKNVVWGFYLSVVTLLMIACSSEDPEASKVESSVQSQLSAENAVKRTTTLNGATVSSAGDVNSAAVSRYLKNAGIPQGIRKMDDHTLLVVKTYGIMSTNNQSDTALSECVATSGLRALKNLSSAVGVEEIRSQDGETNRETQLPLTFDTDEGSVRYRIQSRATTVTTMLAGERYKSFNEDIQMSGERGSVCTYEKEGSRKQWNCDIQALNNLFRHDQKALKRNIIAKWIHSELDGAYCSSAFGFKIP